MVSAMRGNCVEKSIESLLMKDFMCTRLITLNRPASLNALSLEMAQQMLLLYRVRPHPRFSQSAIYLLKGAGDRSFCAGGDILNIVKSGNLALFLKETYRLNHYIITMPNPQVSLWNGYVMGGGVGVSIHGKYRVASERATFAMPETAIGMFPDNGITYIFPRLPVPGIGLYLGLTGARVKGADLAHLGLATHFVPSESFPALEERLCSVEDPARVDDCLDAFAVKDLPPFSLDPHRATLEKSFALEESTTVEGILAALQEDGSAFARGATHHMRKASPICLKVTLELFRRAAKMTTLREAMAMEYNVIQRISVTDEFSKGVTARMIDKTDPKWDPSTVEEVTTAQVSHFFDTEGLEPWDPERE